MELTTVLYDTADRVATITLNRPDARNAATFEMEEELIQCFAEAEGDPDVGCIVLTGAGKGFCAGDDVTKAWGDPRMEATLAELASPDPPITPLVGAMLACDTPMIAAVNGAAVGIGMDLALLCDLRIASEYRAVRAAVREARADVRRHRAVVAAADRRTGPRDRAARHGRHARRDRSRAHRAGEPRRARRRPAPRRA